MQIKKLIVLALALGWTEAKAQVFNIADDSGLTSEGHATENVVVADNIWDNWFVQLGLDMTLQNPYGCDFSKVFPNGKSFGADLAVGKWFSHQVGVRGQLNWENKLPLLENGHANWLAPFYQPGENRRKGGYIAAFGEVLINLHNILGPYRPERKWNLSVFPRIGANYNFGVTKASLLAGVGVLNTYRISPNWSLYGDIAYNMTGSGFVGRDKTKATGTGSNSNGYLTMVIGAQVDLGRSKAESGRSPSSITPNSSPGVLTNGIWDNWFLQLGADISLMNPYGSDLSEVIPKGTTLGLNGAMGKWFTPEFGLRARVQWDNGLIPNNKVEWLPPADDPKQNYKKGGLATFAIDAIANLTHIVKGYDPERRWHTSAYVRAGIITQFVESSASPLLGVGLEETYRLNDRLSLFGSMGYQVSTSEGMGYSVTGMGAATGSNGFFDIDFGIRMDLGQNKFYRNIEAKKTVMAAGPVATHNWPRFAVNTAASVGVAYAVKTALKSTINEERPDHSDNNSFPSGHVTMAFAAARSIDKEFRQESIWIPIASYAAATAVGIERVARERHHWYDVAAGAAIGYGTAELTWWLSDKFLGTGRNIAVGTSGNMVNVKYNF